MSQGKRIVLASRPVGEPKPSDFRFEDSPVPTPGPGQVLLRTIWLSLDPYMRGRMSDGPSYAQPVPIGGVMEGGTVSEVIASDNPGFAKGDVVLSRAGWQVTLLERAERVAAARTALVLWPNGRRALDALDPDGGWAAIAAPLPACVVAPASSTTGIAADTAASRSTRPGTAGSASQ